MSVFFVFFESVPDFDLIKYPIITTTSHDMKNHEFDNMQNLTVI